MVGGDDHDSKIDLVEFLLEGLDAGAANAEGLFRSGVDVDWRVRSVPSFARLVQQRSRPSSRQRAAPK
jgi:hypothetical protein